MKVAISRKGDISEIFLGAPLTSRIDLLADRSSPLFIGFRVVVYCVNGKLHCGPRNKFSFFPFNFFASLIVARAIFSVRRMNLAINEPQLLEDIDRFGMRIIVRYTVCAMVSVNA